MAFRPVAVGHALGLHDRLAHEFVAVLRHVVVQLVAVRAVGYTGPARWPGF